MLETLVDWVPTLLSAVITAVMVKRDPRRMRCAVFFLLTCTSACLRLVDPVTAWIWRTSETEQFVIVLSVLILGLLLILGVAVFLIATGVVLIRREGFGLAHSLSLIGGIAMLGYLGATVASTVANYAQGVVFLIFLGLPAFTFSFGLVAYLLYSALLGFYVRRWGKTGPIVVVLGSGLIGDRVPPLLARRVDLGVETFEKAQTLWPNPLLIMSGGKGSDELLAEGAAMLAYAQNSGLDTEASARSGGEVVVESASATTRQNLRFSRKIVEEEGREGRWTVVTSDFHAFRAANLMSRMGIPGDAIGARTTAYFWMSAKLREFIAILVDSKVTTLIFLGISAVPLIMFGISTLLAAIGG